jgi:hypothetical protein
MKSSASFVKEKQVEEIEESTQIEVCAFVFLHHKFYWKLQRLNKVKECIFCIWKLKRLKRAKKLEIVNNQCDMRVMNICFQRMEVFFPFDRQVNIEAIEQSLPLSFFLSSENGWSFFSIQQMNKW